MTEFRKEIFNNQEKIELLKSISLSISKCGFYYDEIIELFDTVDWSFERDQFNDLLVKFRNIEPDLAAELLSAYKNKYCLGQNTKLAKNR